MTRTRSARLAAPAALALVVPLALVAEPTPAQASEPVHPPVKGSFTLVGRGFGHGRGMSQWGSYQQATEGRTWQQIIGFYYPGATRATLSNRTIRVNTTGRTGNTVRVSAESGLTATDGAGQSISLPTSDAGTPITSWEVSLPSSGGSSTTATLWFRTASARKPLRSTESGHWTVSATDGSVRALNSSGTHVATYLGRFTGNRSGSGIVPVLATSLENYTRQVVPWENIASWPVQAQAAQAVAARSYGAWYTVHPRASLYDICDTTSCQVMGGITQETTQTAQGVAASKGVVLTYGGSVARTEFSSSNGGQIAPGDSFAPVKADPYEMRLPTTVTTWTGTASATSLQNAWPQVGTVTGLAVSGRDGHGQWGGRVTRLTLTGTAGSVTITPGQLASRVTGWKGAYFTLADGLDGLAHDWSGDGHTELFSRDSAGYLYSANFTGSTSLAASRRVGTGWNGFVSVTTGQFTKDRLADALALTSAGALRLYPSTGTGWQSATTVATGLGGYRNLTLAPSLNAGKPMLLARRTSDGALVGFRCGRDGTMNATPLVLTPSGWPGNSATAMFAVRDISGDNADDVVVRTRAGDLLAFRGTSAGTVGSAVRIGTGWGSFASISSPGDINADGRSDLVARRGDGGTVLYRTRSGVGFLSPWTLASQVSTLLP